MTHKLFYPARLALAALAAALTCAGPQAALARSSFSDDGFNQPQVADTVQISSADTSTTAGAQGLLHKIRMASVEVCAGQGDDPVYATGGYFGCVRRTTADAVARVGNPRLTALYRGEADTVLANNR